MVQTRSATRKINEDYVPAGYTASSYGSFRGRRKKKTVTKPVVKRPAGFFTDRNGVVHPIGKTTRK